MPRMSTRAIPPLVALTAEPGLVDSHELAVVAAALQTQVTDAFAPIWHAPATVAAFPDASKIPPGYWPIIVKHDLGEPGALGYHVDPHRQPTSYVEHGDDWSVTASHELLEMLGDPWGNRLVACMDPRGPEYGHAHVLVEVCDPCEAFTYPVLGVKVSDFVEPGYYGSHRWSFGKLPANGQTASFLGTVQPLQVASGGYLSWRASDGSWWQRTFFGSAPEDKALGRIEHDIESHGSIRAAIDELTVEGRAHIGSA